MSVVTDVIVTYRYERTPKAIDELNEWLADKGGPLVSLDFQNIPHGGSRVFESTIWVGAYNWIDVDDLLQRFAWVNWASPDTAQIMFHYNHDDAFSMYTASVLRERYPQPDENRAPTFFHEP